MKPGRNDPCPCGSGKKYKKCCYLAEQNSTDISRDHQRQEDALDELDFLRALNGLRRLSLNMKPHIKKYYKIRKLHSEIASAMIQYYDNGKFERKVEVDDISQTKRSKTIHLIESSFDLETREGEHGFYDMLIYKTSPNTNCITEDFIQNRRYRKTEKIEFLHSMLDSKLGLFEITGTDFNKGYAYLREVFTGEEYTIVDVGLSGDQNFAEFYLYTRIITYDSISFGTGLNLVFTKTDNFIKNHIRHHKKDYSPNGEFLRFTQLYNRYSQNPDNVRVVTNTLK